jgi:hypothetical protein
LSAFGLSPSDYASTINVLPDNETPFNLFVWMSTQWRGGMNGYTGMDYNVLFHKMDRMKLSEDEYLQLENDMQIMENAALEQMRENK